MGSNATNVDNIVFSNKDLFEEADEHKGASGHYVHIRIQMRNGRKSLTTIQGLATDLDLKKILKALKKCYSTNGTIVKDEEVGHVIQLQGDQRNNAADFLTKYKICDSNEIKKHGF